MKKCLFKRDNFLEQLDYAADKVGIQELDAKVNAIKDELLPTLTEQQKQLFRQFDDAIVDQGTARVNGAIMLACGCPECR